MLLKTAPRHMYQYRNKTIKNFGVDTESCVEYSFNSLGYRSPYEFDEKNTIVVLGNTISFGIGLTYTDTFSSILEQQLDTKVYNFSIGCYLHQNHDQLALLNSIIQSLDPKHVVFQINNLDRKRISDTQVNTNNDVNEILALYNSFMQELKKMLDTVSNSLIYYDNISYNIARDNFLIDNSYHVDHSIISNKGTFGKKSHKLIGLKLMQKIQAGNING